MGYDFLSDGHCHSPSLVALLNVPVSVCDVLEGVAAIHDRPDVAGLDQFLHRRQSPRVQLERAVVDRDVLILAGDARPAGLLQSGSLRLADRVEHEVVPVAGLERVDLGVVDHSVRAEGLRQLHIGCAADSSDFCTQMLRILHRRCA